MKMLRPTTRTGKIVAESVGYALFAASVLKMEIEGGDAAEEVRVRAQQKLKALTNSLPEGSVTYADLRRYFVSALRQCLADLGEQ